MSSGGTPSPIGSGSATDVGDVKEDGTIDIDDDDNLESARTDKRLNYSHEENFRLVSLLS